MGRRVVVGAADRRVPRAVADVVADELAGRITRDPHDVRLAVHEVVTNAVLHGGVPVTVTIEDRGEEGGVEVVVADAGGRGRGVDPRPHDERGRGLLLARACSDGVTVATPQAVTGWSVGLRYAAALTTPGRP